MIIGDVEKDASIWYNCVLSGAVNFIRIGEKTNIQDGTIIHVSRKTSPTVLEHEVTVGHSATIHACYIQGKGVGVRDNF